MGEVLRNDGDFLRRRPQGLSVISEECDDEEYEDVSGEEELENEEEEDKRLIEQCRLQLTGTKARVKGLQELKELYHRVDSRLSRAKEDEQSRLKKVENFVSNFLEDEVAVEDKEGTELKVFEKMEKLTGRPSFESKMALVEQFMNDKMCLDSTREDSLSVCTGGESRLEDLLEVGGDYSIQENEENVEDSKEDEEKHENPSLEHFTELIKAELNTMKMLRVQLEEKEECLLEERNRFENYKEQEEARIEKERAMLLGDSVKIEKIRSENGKLRGIQAEYEQKVSDLEQKLKTVSSDWFKKSSGWNLTRTKLNKKIEELEKRCQDLEEKLAKVSKTNAVKTKTKNTKRIHFDFKDEKEQDILPMDDTKENGLPKPMGYFDKSKTDSATADVPIFKSVLKPSLNQPKVFDGIETMVSKSGDIKEKRSDGSIHYFFPKQGLRHYVYPDGLEMTAYNNGQVQRKNPDGTREILYPNGCVKVVRDDGKEKFVFPDNTVYQTDEHGNETIFLPNGQKEIHCNLWKKRIYPDGTTTTVYKDGSMETKYPNGRIRIKNPEGKLISDLNVMPNSLSDASCEN